MRIYFPVLLLSMFFLAGMVIPLFQLAPLGIPGEFEYHYVPNIHWGPINLCFALIPIAGIIITFWKITNSKEVFKKGEIAILLLLLVALSFLFHLICAVVLSSFGMAEALYHVVQRHGDGSYLLQATQIDSLGRYLANLDDTLRIPPDDFLFHRSTHPPGFVVFFYALYKVVVWEIPGVLELRDWVWENSPLLRDMMSIQLVGEGNAISTFTATATSAVILLMGSAAILPIPTYFLARPFMAARQALLVATLSTLLPGTHLFNPSTDQILPFVATVVILLGAHALEKRKPFIALLYGMTLGLSLNFSVALGACGILFLFHFLYLESSKRLIAGSKKIPQDSLWSVIYWSAFGLTAIFSFLYLFFDLNVPYILYLCIHNNQGFNMEVQRGYFPLFFLAPLETAYSFGMPLTFVLLVIICSRIWARKMAKPLKGEAFLWAPLATIFLLWILGVNRGEVGRLWLFLYPSLLVSTFIGIMNSIGSEQNKQTITWVLPGIPRRGVLSLFWICLLVFQALQVVFLRQVVDAMFCATALN